MTSLTVPAFRAVAVPRPISVAVRFFFEACAGSFPLPRKRFETILPAWSTDTIVVIPFRRNARSVRFPLSLSEPFGALVTAVGLAGGGGGGQDPTACSRAE